MARRHTIKSFLQDGNYHIYNRGVDNRDIFLEPQDYHTFIQLLAFYLGPYALENRPGFKGDKPSIAKHKQAMNLHQQVQLLAYCLLPNHFHLLVKQTDPHGITQLMRRVGVNYSMYFNSKYHRRGSLFESIYKATIVEGREMILHLTRYIHLNPLSLKVSRFGPVSTVTTARPDEYEYSSYRQYVQDKKLPWLDPQLVLDIFTTAATHRSYQLFVEDHWLNSQSILGTRVLEEEPEKR